ncbi:MAG: restriction endonuclease subunit S, partial [Deltaproteobacteria bacterium]|nr:restriction endonuclease subunit S [Deltaproteobacteria bacterium]
SSQPQITIQNLNNLQIPLAPLNEQLRILEKLEKLLQKVDACKERLDKIPSILKRFRQSVLAAACSGRLTEDWRKQKFDIEYASALLLRIKQKRQTEAETTKEKNQIVEAFKADHFLVKSEELDLNEIPESWSACRIGAIGTVLNGSTPSRKKPEYWNGDIPWVSSGEVKNNFILSTREKITQRGHDNSSVRLLPQDTILLAMIGEGKTRGQTAILKISCTINQNIAAVLLTHGLVSSEYLWRWFQFQYESTRGYGSGSGPQALNCQRVRELPFILPPLTEQREIVRRVEALFKIADQIEERYIKARTYVDKLTQSILAKAFRGELVPQDPNDEPASELLKRIKEEKAKTAIKAKSRKRGRTLKTHT